jgi:hypothetical protein
VFVLLATPACSEDATANPPPPDPPNDGRKSAAHATEVSCASMPEASGDGCAIEAGTGGELFLRGVVLTESEIIRGGGVLLDAAGAIACVGCDCAELAASATTVTCPNSVISPGLVNTHDHLSFVHDWPHPDDGERFEHRHDWRRGLHGHSRLEASDGATTPQLQWGELRFVFGGATSTIGGSGTPGFLRNLEYAPNSEGLGERSISLSTFPLGDGEEGRQLDTGCAYPAMPSREAITLARSYVMHVAEGVDAFARNEFECLSGEGGADLMAPEVSIVHGLALGAPDLARMAAAGAQLVWSPRSNVALYGDTARVTIAATLGVSIALGTGSTPGPRTCCESWRAPIPSTARSSAAFSAISSSGAW